MKQKIHHHLEVFGAPLGALRLSLAQYGLTTLLLKYLYFKPLPYLDVHRQESVIDVLRDYGPAVIFPFWGAFLGGASARAIGMIRRGQYEEASEICLGRAVWVLPIQLLVQGLFTSQRWHSYYVGSAPLASYLLAPVLSDMSLQWSVLLVAAGFILRRMAKGTVQVGEGVRW